MIRLTVLLFLVTLISCKQKHDEQKRDDKYFWVTTAPSKGYRDTSYFHQTETITNDSLTLIYNTGGNFPDTFIFNLKDKSKAFYNGNASSKPLYYNRKVIPGTETIFKYVNDTLINCNGAQYQVYKYFYDEVNTYDVGWNYYWNPDIGIIYIRSTNTFSSSRLYTNNGKTDSCISLMIEVIQKWHTASILNTDTTSI